MTDYKFIIPKYLSSSLHTDEVNAKTNMGSTGGNLPLASLTPVANLATGGAP